MALDNLHLIMMRFCYSQSWTDVSLSETVQGVGRVGAPTVFLPVGHSHMRRSHNEKSETFKSLVIFHENRQCSLPQAQQIPPSVTWAILQNIYQKWRDLQKCIPIDPLVCYAGRSRCRVKLFKHGIITVSNHYSAEHLAVLPWIPTEIAKAPSKQLPRSAQTPVYLRPPIELLM